MTASVTAFGAFLVGLTARVVAVSASVLPEGSGLVLEGMPEERSRARRFGTNDLYAAWAREVRIRVRSTLHALGLPSDFSIRFDPLPARSGCMDLAVLAACLGALGRLGPDVLGSTLFLGELSLTGALRPIRGVLPALRTADMDRRPPEPWTPGDGGWRFVVPKQNRAEASRAGAEYVFAAEHAAAFVNDAGWPGGLLAEPSPVPWKSLLREDEVVGVGLSARTLRALEVAAAGQHGVLLVGPERLRAAAARALHAFLPSMTESEATEATYVASVAGLARLEDTGGLLCERPFRAPHHTCSEVGMVGGGDPIRPGEASLAHEGTLVLDPSPEFKRIVSERLAAALRDGETRIHRKDERVVYPARPAMLVLGTAPCKCEENSRLETTRAGREAMHAKWCSPDAVVAYHGRALGRLAPFVDMRIEVEPDENSPGVRASDARERLRVAENMSNGRPLGERYDGKHCHEPRTRIDHIARTLADLEGEPAVFGRHGDEAAKLALVEARS